MDTLSVMSLFCFHSPQRFRVGYIVFQKVISITAVKSHPHDVPLVVSTEQRPVWTGLQSEWALKSSSRWSFFSKCWQNVLNWKDISPRFNTIFNMPFTSRFVSLSLEWIHQYKQSFAQPDKLQEAVDTFMQDYDTRKEQFVTDTVIYGVYKFDWYSIEKLWINTLGSLQVFQHPYILLFLGL